MAVSYKKLWKLLIDLDMKKKDLQQSAGISEAGTKRKCVHRVFGENLHSIGL